MGRENKKMLTEYRKKQKKIETKNEEKIEKEIK